MHMQQIYEGLVYVIENKVVKIKTGRPALCWPPGMLIAVLLLFLRHCPAAGYCAGSSYAAVWRLAVRHAMLLPLPPAVAGTAFCFAAAIGYP